MTRARFVAQAGVIAAAYAAVTLVVLLMPNQLGWGLVQLRLSEALTVLGCLTPAAIPGLWIGTMVANAFMVTQVGPLAILDVVFGSLATLIGAVWMWRMRSRTLVALAGPVVANALIVPAYLPILLAGFGLYTVPVLGIDLQRSWPAMYVFGFVSVGLGQALVVYGLGMPLLAALKRLRVDRLLFPDDRQPQGGRRGTP